MANKTAGKRYYWLKLHDDFFDTLRMRKLRRAEGGDTFALIYLKLLLKAIKTDGVLTFSGMEDDLAGELALLLGEEVENVRSTLGFLEATGLMKRREDGDVYFPEAVANTGSETASTQRSRECRARAKAREKAASCVTPSAQSDAGVTPM
ncbi:MAG: phage replisome organizer N-terminal domain-containing protein [Clostridia bacterium]|nr:phage replisome organizer N-terminal domain-containing protein [Clostridia bacterium]